MKPIDPRSMVDSLNGIILYIHIHCQAIDTGNLKGYYSIDIQEEIDGTNRYKEQSWRSSGNN